MKICLQPPAMTSRNRIFIGTLLIYTCGVLFLLYHLLQDIDPRYRESAEDSLVETAHLLATLAGQNLNEEGQVNTAVFSTLFQDLYQREVSANIFGIHKDKIQLRTYMVDAKGQVIYDSTGLNLGADFSRWRDVSLVLKGEYAARTTSDVANDKDTAVIYVAAPIYHQGQIIGAVTVGKPVGSYGQYITKAQNKIISVGIFSALAIAILALIVVMWLTKPLGLVTEYIRYIRAQKSINLPRLGRRALDLFSQGYENLRNALAGQHYIAEYVQTLTHELKSPLSAIKGAAELLQGPMPEEGRKKFLLNIERETQRVQELVDHMMELTTLEQIRFIKNPQPIPLAGLLEELTSSAQAIAAARGIQVLLKLPPSNLDAKAEGDPLLLHRALRNLLDNAIDFSPEKGLIEVQLLIQKRIIEIHISDQGSGIPEYAKKRIFDRFYSLPRPSGKKKSSGLGLAFVKEIIILHHGSVSLDNRVDSENHIIGALALIKLPLSD